MIVNRVWSHLKTFKYYISKINDLKINSVIPRIDYFINCILFRTICYTVEKAYLTDKDDFHATEMYRC